ncbi:MAG: prephenate dehydrogenase [Deltaproteobacteria bacterium]|nr:prephenate dehydrogenase [Deltaproteobacteria bacterium]
MSAGRPGDATPAPLRFERIAVLGLGLLGGSLAWAARERALAAEVVGCGRRAEPLRRARERGLVDRTTADPVAAVAGADLVVLATPVGAMAPLLAQVAPALAPGVLVTDVGSVKALLADTLPGLLPPAARFVGSHPMAGSHEKGPDHARPDLFEGAVCVVTPVPGDAPEAVERIEALWRAVGARVVRRDPAGHDREVAWMSHLPHVLAFAYARALGEAPAGARAVAGPGFRDFTRIARSDAELWADILVANAKAVGGPLARVARELAEVARRLEAGDSDALERWITEARARLADDGREE